MVLFHEGKPVRVNVVEVQLSIDPDKRFSWPNYLTKSRDQHRCPADLLIIAPDPSVADWSGEPIEIGPPGFVLTPPVLRGKLIPVVTDPEDAARRPELAVLSAMAHGDTIDAQAIVQAVLPALEKLKKLDKERSNFYFDMVYNSINEAARRALETKMKGYVYTSPYIKKYFEGLDEGRKEGRENAINEGIARALLNVLRVRGISVPEATRQRVVSEKDTARLERWHERAIVASSLADVFEEPS